jgi:hypothetical protein
MKNPFIFGRIVKGEQFCNRVKEMEELGNYIQNQTSVWLYSPRRYGKTSLILKTFAQQQNVKTIYFDLFNIRSSSEFAEKYINVLSHELMNWNSGLKSIMRVLTKALNNISPTFTFDAMGNATIGIDSRQERMQDNLSFILDLPEKIKYHKPVCIAFDEFQEIIRIDPFLVNIMRSVFQNQQNVSYIFSGSKESLMEGIFSDMKSPFYQFGIRMNLSVILQKELNDYILLMFNQTGLTINDDIITGILEISGNHPHYTQFIASVAWDLIFQDNEQDNNFLQKCFNRILEGQSESFYFLYEQLNNNQRKILFALSQEQNLNIYAEEIRQKYKLPPSSTITTAVNALVKKSVILKNNGSFQFENPIFKLWINNISN